MHPNCEGMVSRCYGHLTLHIHPKPDDHQSSSICCLVAKCHPKPIWSIMTLEPKGTHMSPQIRCHQTLSSTIWGILWSAWRTPTFQLCLHEHNLLLLWDPLEIFKGHTNFLSHHQKEDYTSILHWIGNAWLHYRPSQSNRKTGTWYQRPSFSK